MSVLLDGKQTDIIKTANGEYVYIDTRWTLDHGWETMVFTCDESGQVTDWCDLDCEIYDTKEQADIGHTDMINRWMHKKWGN